MVLGSLGLLDYLWGLVGELGEGSCRGQGCWICRNDLFVGVGEAAVRRGFGADVVGTVLVVVGLEVAAAGRGSSVFGYVEEEVGTAGL